MSSAFFSVVGSEFRSMSHKAIRLKLINL